MGDERRSMNPVVGSESAPEQSGTAVPQNCCVCGKALGSRWFCRLPCEGGRVALCSPKCMSGYWDAAHPPTTDRQQEFDTYESSLHFFIDGERPWL
jgi:hypothetical protein